MKKMMILTTLTAFVLLMGTIYTADADCGCPSCAQKAAAKQAETAEAGLPCGCPMTEESMQMHLDTTIYHTVLERCPEAIRSQVQQYQNYHLLQTHMSGRWSVLQGLQ